MKKFLYLYFGGTAPASPEAGKALMDNWMAYFGRMGSRIVDGGAPLAPGKPVGGSATSHAVGYSIISAETLDEAIALTEGHPHRSAGGSVEVCEILPVPG